MPHLVLDTVWLEACILIANIHEHVEHPYCPSHTAFVTIVVFP